MTMRGSPVSLFDAFGLFSLLFAQTDLHGDMMWSELGRIQFCTTWPCRREPMILLLSPMAFDLSVDLECAYE